MEERVAEAVGYIYEGGEDLFRIWDEISGSEPQRMLRARRSQYADNLPGGNGIVHRQ